MRFFSKTQLIIFSIIFTSLIIFPSLSFADEIETKTAEQNEIIQSINIKQTELDKLSNKYTAAIIEQETIKQEIAAIEEKIKELNKKIENKKNQLKKQCVAIYKQGNTSLLSVLLGSSDFKSFINNADFCYRYINQTNNILEETKVLKEECQEEKKNQEKKQEELSKTIKEIEEAKNLADIAIAELQAQYEQLNEEIAILILQQQLSINYSQDELTNLLNGDNGSNQIYQIVAQIQAKNAANGISSDYNDIVSRAYSMLGASYS